MLKPNQNPPIIWPEVDSIRRFTGRWWVAHTRSRNEKALANDLMARGVQYFLPMSWRAHRCRGRTIRSLLPLFTSYLFFCGDEEHRLAALKTNRVAGVIEVTDQDKLVHELCQFEHALRAGAVLVPHRYVRKGQRCRVIAGPLTGLEGIVVTSRTATRLVLQIDILGRATSVEIDIDMVEVLD